MCRLVDYIAQALMFVLLLLLLLGSVRADDECTSQLDAISAIAGGYYAMVGSVPLKFRLGGALESCDEENDATLCYDLGPGDAFFVFAGDAQEEVGGTIGSAGCFLLPGSSGVLLTYQTPASVSIPDIVRVLVY